MADNPSANLAAVLESIDELGHDYVLYHDRAQQERLVLIVEGLDDVKAMGSTLERLGGAKTRNSDSGYEMRLTTTEHDDVQRGLMLEIRVLSSTNGVANMLWRAASQESAIAAGRSVDKK